MQQLDQAVPRASLQRILREPVIHFALLGALLLGGERWLSPNREATTIRLSAETDAQIIDSFKKAQGREPTPEEIVPLRRAWVDAEVLYREGLALRLDRGDPMIRDRVALKTQILLAGNVNAAPLDDAGLRHYFEINRARYDQPTRVDFYEAELIEHGADQASSAARMAQALNDGEMHDEWRANLKVFRGRPRPTIVSSFGESFAAALEALPAKRWAALEGKDGWHIVRLDSIAAPVLADYEPLKGQLLEDARQGSMQTARVRALEELRKKYQVIEVAAYAE